MKQLVYRAALAVTCALGFAASSYAHPGVHDVAPWQAATKWPDRIVLTFETDPARSLAVSWRTSSDVTATIAQIALATPDARFDLAARTVAAETETLDLQGIEHEGVRLPMPRNAGLPSTHYHSVRFDGLEPDTLYAYRVQGADGIWSEWFQARTAPLSGPLRFIYVGDAQNGITSHWSRVIRAAFQAAPDARFILHAGDLVNKGSRDYEWAEWFKASGFIHGMIPAIPVAGNHEYEKLGLTEDSKQRVLSALWRPQFRLPADPPLPAAMRETVYDVRYSPDLHVFVLDSNLKDYAVQAEWLDRKLAASDARWRVVTMHHPVYSSGRDRDNKTLREMLLPVLTGHRVDLVLQGHDHTYARGMIGSGEQSPERSALAEGDELAVMFVNSVSGPKQYKFKDDRWNAYKPTGVGLERFAENSQFFQVIDIDGGRLDYRAYTADGQLYDSVVIVKDEAGRKRIEAGNASTMKTRLFDETMPYESVGDTP
ncbi:metallophosphoesterase [Enterovirga sp. GCM10030262]|uniref:metallophosphoesterase n=1 Tax=Enterovirga sp. GCM10030262 TaxID=3273391 RepID=UPI003618CC8D